jgi:hypothetical protein
MCKRSSNGIAVDSNLAAYTPAHAQQTDDTTNNGNS